MIYQTTSAHGGKKKISWTTIGGFLSTIGLTMSASPVPTVHYIGIALGAIGVLITGKNAQDVNQ